MRCCLVTDGALNAVWQEKLNKIDKSDLVVFGFKGLGLVSYKKELEGESEYFQDVAKLSKQLCCTVVCGCDTDTYGTFRHSAVIADKGKILGVSDMSHAIGDSEFVAGAGFRVYDTSAGKIGIIVCEDILFPEVARVLALCDADLIVCVYKRADTFMPEIMLRAGAFANGVAMVLCAENYSAVANLKGEITAAGSADIFRTEIKIEKDYRLISSRRRGLYREFGSGC